MTAAPQTPPSLRPAATALACFWLFCVSLIQTFAQEAAAEAVPSVPQAPDIVLFLCDDLNSFYLGFADDPDVHTPHIDALAAEGTVFTRCYSASTVCMPARTSLITGLYPHSTGCWGNANELFVNPRLTSLFANLDRAGYATGVIGKTHWYAGNGFKNQFESKKAYMEGIGIHFYKDVATTFASRGGSGLYQDYLRKIGKFEAQSADLTERLRNNQYVARPSLLEPEQTGDWMMVDLATEYIGKAPKTQPFALMIGISNPHSPFDPPGKYASQYEPENLSLRPNVEVPFNKYGTEYNAETVKEARAAYLGKISFIDDLVGRTVDALKARGTWDRTLFVFTADHGLLVGEHRNISKGQFWEEVARVPLIIRAPGLGPSGTESSALCQLIDVYPTLVEAAGGEISPHVDGRSLLPQLHDPAAPGRDAVFTEISHGEDLNYLVRDERYKWFLMDGETHLYDLETDPFEQTNLIGTRQGKEIAPVLKDRLRRFLMTTQLDYSAGYTPAATREKERAEKEAAGSNEGVE